MSKKVAKFNFIFASILIILATAMCFIGFNMPNSTDRYVGLFNAITKSNDFADGYVAEYSIVSENYTQQQVEDASVALSNIAKKQGFNDVKVYPQNGSIRVEVSEIAGAQNFLSTIGTPVDIRISSSDSSETDNDLVSSDFVDASLYSVSNLTKKTFGVTISLTQNGQEKLKKLSKAAADDSQKIYVFIGDDSSAKSTISGIDSAINSSTLSFSLTEAESSAQVQSAEASAKNYVLQFQVATAGLKIKTFAILNASSVLTQSSYTFAMISLATLFVVSIVAMCVIYRHLGLISGLCSLIYFVISCFFLQAIPGIYMSLSAIFALAFSIILINSLFAIMFNKAKKEYVHTKRISLSFKNAFKKSIIKILDICVLIFIINIILVFFNISAITSFAVVMSVTSVVALLTVALFGRGFMEMYLAINKKDYKKLNFVKEED